MKYDLEIKEEASEEISDAFTWYEDQKEGLGMSFVTMLESYFDAITTKPLHYPVQGKYRVAIMRQFPYKVVFEIEESQVIVYAVFHMSRNPKDLAR